MHKRKAYNSIVDYKVNSHATITHTKMRKSPELQNFHTRPITASHLPQQVTNITDFMVISPIHRLYINIYNNVRGIF